MLDTPQHIHNREFLAGTASPSSPAKGIGECCKGKKGKVQNIALIDIVSSRWGPVWNLGNEGFSAISAFGVDRSFS